MEDPFEKLYLLPRHSLTFISNGEFRFLFRRDLWDTHFGFLGLNSAEQIAYGREAMAFFDKQFGINIQDRVTDSDLLGFTTFEDDTFSLILTTLDPESNFRLLVETEDTRSKVYRRARTSRSDWRIGFKKPFTPPPGAIYNRTIPAGAQLAFGDFYIPTAKEGALSGDNIRVQLKSTAPILAVVGSPTADSVSIILNLEAFHEKWGFGTARGIPAVSNVGTMGKNAGRFVITFPRETFEPNLQ